MDRLAYLTCRGGWPKAVLKKSEKAALAQAFNYYDSVVSNDIKRVDDVDRDEELTKRIMRSYARNQASQATAGTILADIKNNGDEQMAEYGLLVEKGDLYDILNLGAILFARSLKDFPEHR